MANWKRGQVADACGTSLIGEISVSYKRLVELFGEPSQGDGYKTDAEWVLVFSGSTGAINIKPGSQLVATIYNWKDGRSYCGADGTDVEDIIDWHVGGVRREALWLVQELVR